MPDYFDTGYCVRQASWHGKEKLVDRFPTDWNEAREWAGLMWEPEVRTMYVPRMIPAGMDLPDGTIPGPVVDGFFQAMVPVNDHRLIVRNDTQAELYASSDTYRLITHAEMGGLLEMYLESWGKSGANLQFETAGSVQGGRQVWALVRLDEPYTIPGDPSPHYPYVVLLNSHDGTLPCVLQPTQVRVVCWNTWQAALAEGQTKGFDRIVIRHSKNSGDRLEAAGDALSAMRADQDRYVEAMTELSMLRMSDQQVQLYLDKLIPVPVGAASERTIEDRRARQAGWRALYESRTGEGIAGTAYGVVQATGEMLDHVRSYRSEDTYLTRTLITPETIKARAVKLAREVCRAG